jgi:hypothetical protein
MSTGCVRSLSGITGTSTRYVFLTPFFLSSFLHTVLPSFIYIVLLPIVLPSYSPSSLPSFPPSFRPSEPVLTVVMFLLNSFLLYWYFLPNSFLLNWCFLPKSFLLYWCFLHLITSAETNAQYARGK